MTSSLKPPGGSNDPVRQGYAVYNVVDFGARGDASTDDTEAIQRAVAQCVADGGGTVYLPPGDYRVNTTAGHLISHTTAVPVTIQGAGHGVTNGSLSGTRIYRTAGTNRLVSMVGTGITSATRVTGGLVDIELFGGNVAGTVCHLERINEMKISGLRVHNTPGAGLVMRQVWNTHVDSLQVENCGTGTATPAFLIDGISGESATDTLIISSLQLEGNTGTDLKISGSTSAANPSQKIKLGNVKVEATGNRSWPVFDLENTADLSVSNTGVLLLHASSTSKVVQGGTAGSNGIEFTNLHIDHRGSPTEYVSITGSNRWAFANLYCTGTPSNKYIKIDSAVGSTAVRLVNYTPTSQALAMDDQRSGCNIMARPLRVPVEKISAGAVLNEYANGVSYWELSASAFGILTGNLQVPYDAAAGLSPTLRATWSSADTSGNVVLRGEAVRLRPASSDASAAATGVDVTTAVAGTAHQVKTTDFAMGLTVQPGDAIAVRFYRNGGAAGDTATNVMRLLSLDLIYERQL